MEPHVPNTDLSTKKKNILFSVTPLSKYLALALFIILPFLGFWLGTLYAPVQYASSETSIPAQKITTPVAINAVAANTTYQLEIQSRADKKTPDYDIPQTEIMLDTLRETGTTKLSLGIFDGSCTVDTIINIYDNVKTYITTQDQVVTQVSCWFAGAGSETYLYKKTTQGKTNFEVITFETGGGEAEQ